MRQAASLTRRLTLAVLSLELIAALVLLAAVTLHEKQVQYAAFDANLRAGANALLGDVQEGMNDDVLLDQRELSFPPHTVFQVTDEHGRVLGQRGRVPSFHASTGRFGQAMIDGRSYRLFSLTGQRNLDPGRNGGVHHELTIVYGQSDVHVWHEVVEAVRFFAVCTVGLLGLTALLLVWLVRRQLAPIRQLASAAGEISSTQWTFYPPQSANDLVELRPLVVAIETALARLEGAFAQQKRFTSDAAHELKTDLAIVKSSLQLVALRKRTVEEHERGLAVGLSDLTRLEQTVQKMLSLARLEQSPTGSSTCSMHEAFEDARRQSLAMGTLKSVTITLHMPADVIVPLAHDDAELLCSNILVNALQHSPDHGVVEVVAEANESWFQLSVRDHGSGVRMEEATLLFEPFYRSDASRSRKSGGSGLGLSICKALCERVGGSIHIANHPEGGALVTVELPVAQVTV